MPAPTPAQVRQHVAELRRRQVRDAGLVLIRGDAWHGPDRLDVGDVAYRVVATASPLHVREELTELPPGMGLVVVTPLAERDLGGDVLARAAKRRVLSVDAWDMARELFRAGSMDPALGTARWMAEALVELAPAEGYPAVPSGVLTADAVWEALLTRGLGLPDGRPDALALATWADADGARQRFEVLSEGFRDGVRKRVGETAGPVGLAMLDALTDPAGYGVVALGLACRVLFSDTADRALADAAIRFERFHRQRPLAPEVGRLWAEAAERVLAGLDQGQGQAAARTRADRADRLLVDLGAGAHLYASVWSPGGLEQRAKRFAQALRAALTEASALADVEAGADALLAHRLLTERLAPVRRSRVEMARRLVRWLHRAPAGAPTHLVDAVAHYAHDGSFVDYARLVLFGGDQPLELGEAYGALLARARERRERDNEQFGRLLAEAGVAPPDGAHGIVPVEHVLDEVLAPVARHRPVLLLVMDGLSLPVARELVPSLTDLGWTQWRPANLGEPTVPLVGLAAVPSITEVSRTSLFSGALVTGAAADEKRAFAAHPALAPLSSSSRPPVVFHKGELRAASGRALSPVVHEALATPEQRVVAVVVNAVDDLLFKGDQIQPRWTFEMAPLVPELFEAARVNGRAVVLTSDHGHLLDDDTTFLGREAGERWREDAAALADGELRVQGRRVVGRGAVVVPWSERTRYGAKRNGYHGGLSPQEMVLPLTVLAWGEEGPEGCVMDALRYPSWWYEAEAERAAVPAPAPPPQAGKKVAARPLLEIAEPEQARPAAGPPAHAWVDDLLSSARYGEQRAAIPERSRPPEHELRELLTVLAERGGRMTIDALSNRLGLPPVRLSARIAAARRVLNVDGARVLHEDAASYTVELNQSLLVQQFELTPQ